MDLLRRNMGLIYNELHTVLNCGGGDYFYCNCSLTQIDFCEKCGYLLYLGRVNYELYHTEAMFTLYTG